MKIAILQGNSESQITTTTKWHDQLLQNGHEISVFPFQSADFVAQMDQLLHAESDLILAYGLDILSIGMTGGDYYINKLFQPVLICLDQPLGEDIHLLEKRMNISILFYSTIRSDVEAIRNLPQPLFAGLVSDFEDPEAVIKRSRIDLYEDI